MVVTLQALLFDSVIFIREFHFTEMIPGILFLLLFYLSFTLLISWDQRKLNRIQMVELGLQEEQGIHIKVFAETHFKINERYYFTHKATLYIRDEFIYIGPRRGDWYSAYYRFHLPILFARVPEGVKARTKINNVYAPISIQPGDGDLVEIVFKEVADHYAETSLYIECCNPMDYEKLRPHFFSAAG